MSETRPAGSSLNTARPSCPYRVTFVAAESVLAVAGAAGAVQLATGTFAPPVSDLAPLGLTTWVLPAVWLFATVAVPSAAAAALSWHRSTHAPVAVAVASAALAVELAVQVPFVGPSALQVVFGAAAVTLGGLAYRARRSGWSAST